MKRGRGGNTWAWTPGSVDVGANNTVSVYVRSAGSTAASEAVKAVGYTVIAGPQ